MAKGRPALSVKNPLPPLVIGAGPPVDAPAIRPASGPSGFDQTSRIAQIAENHLKRMLYYRRQFDARSILFYRQYLSQQDQRMFPDNLTPRSNSFVPYSFANVDTVASLVIDAFFATDDWFEARARGARPQQPAEKLRETLKYMFSEAGFRQALSTCVRNACIYGYMGMKVDWDDGYDRVVDLQPTPLLDTVSGQPITLPDGTPITTGVAPAPVRVPRNRPRFWPIDPFDLLLDPDLKLAAHMVERDWGSLKREFEANPKLYWPSGMAEIEAQVSGMTDPDATIIRLAELWDDINRTKTLISFGEDYESLAWKDMRASYRTGSLTPWKRQILGGRGILLFGGDYPDYLPRMPILTTSFSKLQSEVYGLGVIEITSTTQDALNRMVNMVVDNWNMGINRRYLVDADADIDRDQLENLNVPGATIDAHLTLGRDIDKVLHELPTHTPVSEDYEIIKLFRDMIQTATGIAPVQNSDGLGKGVNDAAQAMAEVYKRLRTFVKNVEDDIVAPALKIATVLLQTKLPPDAEIMITGEPAQIPRWPQVRPAEIMGGFDFVLSASDFVTSRTVRQRNLLALANVLGQSPYINQYEAVKEVLRAFEIRNYRRLLKTEEEVQQQQQAQQQAELQQKLQEAQIDAHAKEQVALIDANASTEEAQRKIAARMQEHIVDDLFKAETEKDGKKSGNAKGAGRPRTFGIDPKLLKISNSTPFYELGRALSQEPAGESEGFHVPPGGKT